MLLPGSFSGSIISAKPHRGPEPKSLMSFAIFIKLTAITFKAPDTSTMASCAARASNLLGADTNGRPKNIQYFVKKILFFYIISLDFNKLGSAFLH